MRLWHGHLLLSLYLVNQWLPYFKLVWILSLSTQRMPLSAEGFWEISWAPGVARLLVGLEPGPQGMKATGLCSCSLSCFPLCAGLLLFPADQPFFLLAHSRQKVVTALTCQVAISSPKFQVPGGQSPWGPAWAWRAPWCDRYRQVVRTMWCRQGCQWPTWEVWRESIWNLLHRESYRRLRGQGFSMVATHTNTSRGPW